MYIYYHIYSCSTHFSFASLYVWFSRFVLHGAALALPGTFVPGRVGFWVSLSMARQCSIRNCCHMSIYEYMYIYKYVCM